MAAGSKKNKAKDKNGKAAAKQKNKKGKSPEVTEPQPNTTDIPAPGSPALAAQTAEEGRDQSVPAIEPSVEVEAPPSVSAPRVLDEDTTPQANPDPVDQPSTILDKPVSAYEVFDDDTAPRDASDPEADQPPIILDKPVSAYEVFDDDAAPRDASDPEADQPSTILNKPVSAYEVFDDDTAPQDVSDTAVDKQSPAAENPVSADEVLDHDSAPQDASDPVVDESQPTVENPLSAYEVLDHKTAPEEAPNTLADHSSPLADKPLDEEPHLDEPSLTQPPIEHAEFKEPISQEPDSAQFPTETEDAHAKEHLADQTEQVEPHQDTPSEETTTVVSPPPANPFSPVAAGVPLPSPSLTEARYLSSPSQETQLYHPYSPYASPNPYTAPAHYACSPIAYASPVPYAASPVPTSYASPNAYASPVPRSAYYVGSSVPYTSPAAYAGSPVPYASPAGYAGSPAPYASPIPYSLPGPYASAPVPYASSVDYTSSPVPKVSSPLAHSHRPQMSPTMSPTATPPPQDPPAAPMAPPPAPPSTAPSVPTAYETPVMASARMMSPYGAYSPHHVLERAYSIQDQSYQASYQALQNLSMGAGQPYDNGSPPEGDSEHIELLQRIQSALPDINRLLHGFRTTHNKLSTREAEIKHIGSQHEQALMHKEYYIEALQAQIQKTANESAEEASKLKKTINELRLELGDLQEKQTDLEGGLLAHQKTNEELTHAKVELEDRINKLNDDIQEANEAHEKELETQKQEREKALEVQKRELTELFEEIKNEDEKTAAENLEAREKELRDEHEAARGEWEKVKSQMQESFETQRAELEATKIEVASQIAALESKETEMQAKLAELASVREELTARLAELEASRNELEQTNRKHTEESEQLRQGHAGELENLRQSHDERLAAATKEMHEKIAAIETQFNEKEQLWAKERADIERCLAEKEGELSSAEREKEKLEEDGIVKEQRLQRAVDEMRMTIDNLGGDCDRLRKTLLSLGEATDLRNTKGDQFLTLQLPPHRPTQGRPLQDPHGTPPFLDNTPSSRELRCAYIQHIISKTLTFRIFQPFLFTLGRRYDKADTFFQMLSMDIRRKSVRREAFWRQQTLKAAYTTSDAKQSINVAAAVIVDEIIDHIKHYADPKHLDSLLISVRKIVKLAAETWRHARVERELVIASFPAPDAESVSNVGWLEYAANREQKVGTGVEPSRHVVLRTFPRITREAAHEDFANDEEKATSCTYSQGVVLYSDSSVVMGRLQELAKRSTDCLVAEQGQTSPSRRGVENLSIDVSTPKVMTVRSAPTSPGAKGQFMRM
ncbi:hypothetical protein N7535_008835 [Penicillium sp. DV-2018c]|nr:hypothetical protein N7535_008835 [Penicillium sp. DV-2018c]